MEVHLAKQGPLGGLFGLVLGYDRGGLLAGGVGMGVGDYEGYAPPLGLFGRARLLRLGPLAFGVALSLVREHHEANAWSGIPDTPYYGASAHWTWSPAYRADLQVFAEILAANWSFRLEGGVARRLNQPDCAFVGYTADYRNTTYSTCAEAPSAYQWNRPPEGTIRPLSLVLEHRFDFSQPTAGAISPDYRSPETALRLSLYSTILPILVGSVMIATGVNHNQSDGALVVLGATSVVLGTALGPSVGLIYADEYARAWGHGVLRLLGIGLFAAGTVAYMRDNLCEYCTGSASSSALLILGFGTALATVASSIYDIATAPHAARRENERRGSSALAIVPAMTVSASQATKGLAVAGRF